MDSSRSGRDRSGHKGTIALVLAGLAVVIATTGTAVAVTASTVRISDSKYPKRIARVDSTGHLLTRNSTSAIPASTISSTNLLTNLNGDNFVTSPTTATLAITKIAFSETAASAGVAGSNIRVYVYRVGVDGAGKCAATGYVLIGLYQFNAGDEVLDPFPHPLLVRPVGKAKYCLDLYTAQLGTGGGLSYYPTYTVSAYVASGTYKGLGRFASPAKAPARVGANGDGK